MLSILTLVGAFVLLSLLAYKAVAYFTLAPLSKLPIAHPTCWISTDRWLSWHGRREAKSLYAAHQKHGPIVRIGPTEVSVNSLDGLRHIYNTRGLGKHPWYEQLGQYSTPNLVSTLDHGSHSEQKRMISSVYAKSYVQRSADLALLSSRIVFERFLPLLKGYAEHKEGANIVDLGQWAGIDLMTAYLFGTAHGTDFLSDETGRNEYFEEWIQLRDHDGIGIGEKKVVESTIMKLLSSALASEADSSKPGESNGVVAPLLYSRLSSKAKAEERQPTQDELMKRCASEMLDHIIAAHETFAITLTYVVYRMSLNPSLQAELRSELGTLDPMIEPEEAGDTLPAPDTIDGLPLLDAILQETLRVHTPVPGRLPRVAGKDGVMLHGHHIPPGTTVSCNAYSLHRDAETFPRPFEWLPQRWMSAEERTSLGDNFPPGEFIRRWLWAFGSGGRMCIGSHYALQALKLLIAAIYTNFQTNIIDDEGIEQSDAFIAGPKSNKLIVQFCSI